MAKKRRSCFLLERDQKEIIDELDNEEAGIIFKAIYEYETSGKEIELNKSLRIVFKQFKVKLDFYDEEYEQKCEKNKQNIQEYWDKIKNTNEYDGIQSNTMATNKNKIKENKIKKNKIKESNNIYVGQFVDELPECANHLTENCKEIIDYLNNKIGSKYSYKSESTKKLLKSILKDYTIDDVMLVIDKMCYLWNRKPKKGEKDMRLYLRPSTLFRKSNFENYLGMNIPTDNITTNDIIDKFDFSEFS